MNPFVRRDLLRRGQLDHVHREPLPVYSGWLCAKVSSLIAVWLICCVFFESFIMRKEMEAPSLPAKRKPPGLAIQIVTGIVTLPVIILAIAVLFLWRFLAGPLKCRHQNAGD
jgi:hypothetical protein